RMTTPWKTWTRSRLPSTTRTWTFRVSPGAKSGMSSRRCARSTRSVRFMRGLPVETRRKMLAARIRARELGRRRRVIRAVFGDGVGAPGPRTPERLGAPPARDACVVARTQHLRHLPAAEIGGPRVLGVLEQRFVERFFGSRSGVADHAGSEAGNGFDDGE